MAPILPQVAPAVPSTTPPAEAALAAISCPIDRARQVTGIARTYGTLSPQLAALRRAALVEASADRSLTDLARRVGLSPGRVCQIVGARRARMAVAA